LINWDLNHAKSRTIRALFAVGLYLELGLAPVRPTPSPLIAQPHDLTTRLSDRRLHCGTELIIHGLDGIAG
jgi:hypothetical protein